MKRALRFGGLLCLLLYHVLTAGAQCDATFSYSATSNTGYHFTANQPLQNGLTYYHNWRSNNVVFATTSNADKDFIQPGTYMVCHTVSIQDSSANTICVDSSCIYLHITTNPPCFAPVNIYTNELNAHTFSFTNTLPDYTNVAVQWNFGDGNDTTGIASPTHYYSNLGHYAACLYLSDTVQNCADTFCISVVVDTVVVNPCPLYAYFNYSQPFYSNTNIVFTEQVNGHYDTLLWDYGDGTTSSVFQSLHHFPHFGLYQVCATYTDTTLGCTRRTCSNVQVDTCHANFANFTTNAANNPGQEYFRSNNLSPYRPVWYQWDFGDSTYNTTTLYPTHQYATLDTFTVCLYVNVPGCAVDSQCRQVITSCYINASFTGVITGPNTAQFHGSTYVTNNTGYTWQFGDGTFGNEQDPVHVFATQGLYTVCLIATDTIFGCADTTCSPLLVTALTDTVCGHVFLDYNFNGIQDLNEPPLAGIQILCNPSGTVLTTDSTGYYEGLVPYNIFSSALIIKLLYAPVHYNSMPFGEDEYNYNFTLPNVRQCGFDFGVTTYSARITGKVFGNYNQNGILDAEASIPRQIVKANNRLAVTGSDGSYIMEVPAGIHTLQRDTTGLYSGFSGTPLSYTGVTTTPGGYYQDYNFGIGISSTYLDVTVDLIPTTPVTTTNKAEYTLLTTSLGPYTAYFTHSLVTDAIMSLDSINSPPANYNAATHTTTWGTISGSFQQLISHAYYYVSPSATINQNIYTTARCNIVFGTDANPNNNTDSAHQIVVASFDPNNKLPDDCGTGAEGFIQADKKIKFVINFENTGTYYAMNIVVKDILDSNFDISTFRYVGSSHQAVCDAKVVGDSIYFRFTQIKLPFTAPESHGWVAFEIQTKPNLPPGTQLHNTAAIYFDHNDPVITNTTLHTISGPTAIVDLSNTDKLVAIPNPFTTSLTIGANHFTQGGYTYTLSNLLGQVLLSGNTTGNDPLTIQRNTLPSGTYIVSVYTSNHTVAHIKVVAQ